VPAYADPQDAQNRYSARILAQLTDEQAGMVINPERLNRALEDASAEINSYLGSHYVLPLSLEIVKANQSLLTRLTVDIAVYRLMGFRQGGATQEARMNYEDALRTLEKINQGHLTLGPGVGEAPLENHPSTVTVASRTPPYENPANAVFTEGTLGGFAWRR
jgi:phage gp36-like protein